MESSGSRIPTPLPEDDGLKFVSFPLFQGKGWMRFLGVMSILEGIASALTIVGLLIAWLPVWMGILLFQAASDVERGHLGNDRSLLESANRRLKTYFILRGISILIEIALAMLAIFVLSTLGFLGALSEL